MKTCLRLFVLLLILAMPASALEIEAPAVPEAGRNLMPENTESFASGFLQLLEKAIQALHPELQTAIRICVSLLAVVLFVSVLNLGDESVSAISNLTGAAAVGSLLLYNTDSLIHLASQTVHQLSDYGKLLFPVMATAMSAQGGLTASAGLYMGTSVFSTLLNSVLSDWLVDGVYLFLVLAIGAAALGEDSLKRLRDVIRSAISWILKTALMIFTTYMSITGVVSGTTDAAALKALKVTISTVVPVVGGILSDASESVLVSAAVMKNAAGIYGIFALLAMFIGPFLKIGTQYLMLKASVMVCGLFGTKTVVTLIEDFSAALGLLLAVTGSVCLMLLVSTVCFMKGVGG